MPVPNAVIIALISSLPKILSSLAFQHLKSCRAAEELPVLHGFLPSLQNRRQNHPQRYRFHSFRVPVRAVRKFTRKTCIFKRSLSSCQISCLSCRLSCALCKNGFSQITFATAGFCSKKISSCSLTMLSTALRATVLPSFCFVCPSNCGSSILTLTIAVRPSRMSSPERLCSLSFISLFSLHNH